MSYTSLLTRVIGLRWLLAAALATTVLAGLIEAGHAHASDDGRGPGAVRAHSAPEPNGDGHSDPEANLPYLFAVYIITWAGFFGYIFYMARRQRETRREIDALRSALVERERPAEQGETEP